MCDNVCVCLCVCKPEREAEKMNEQNSVAGMVHAKAAFEFLKFFATVCVCISA